MRRIRVAAAVCKTDAPWGFAGSNPATCTINLNALAQDVVLIVTRVGSAASYVGFILQRSGANPVPATILEDTMIRVSSHERLETANQ